MIGLLFFVFSSTAMTYGELTDVVTQITESATHDLTGVARSRITSDTAYARGCGTPTSLQAFYLAKPIAGPLNKELKLHQMQTYDTIAISQAMFRYRGQDCVLSVGEIVHGLVRKIVETEAR